MHAPILPDDFLIEGKADSLGDAARDLALCQDGVENFPYFLKSHEVFDGRGKGGEIDCNFRNVDRPGERSIGLAAIVLVVPEDPLRCLVAR